MFKLMNFKEASSPVLLNDFFRLYPFLLKSKILKHEISKQRMFRCKLEDLQSISRNVRGILKKIFLIGLLSDFGGQTTVAVEPFLLSSGENHWKIRIS